MSKVLKIGIIGTGSFGKWHARIINDMNADGHRVKLVGVCNRKKESSEWLFREGEAYKGFRDGKYKLPRTPVFFHDEKKAKGDEFWHIKKFLKGSKAAAFLGEGKDMIKKSAVKKPDLVFLILPPELNVEIGKMVLEAGCHLMVEKPMALTKKGCKELIRTAKKNDRFLLTSQQLRFDYGIDLVKNDALFRKIIKKADFIYVEGRGPYPGLGNEKRAESFAKIGVVFDYAPHYVDIIRYLFGEIDPKSIKASQNKNKELIEGKESCVKVSGKTESGIDFAVEMEWFGEKDKGKKPERIVWVNSKDADFKVKLLESEVEYLPSKSKMLRFPYPEEQRRKDLDKEIEYFVKKCKGVAVEDVNITVKDGIEMVELSKLILKLVRKSIKSR